MFIICTIILIEGLKMFSFPPEEVFMYSYFSKKIYKKVFRNLSFDFSDIYYYFWGYNQYTSH